MSPGATEPACATAEPAGAVATPARYDVWIAHRRRDPVRYGFGQRGATWLVDLDDLPRLPRGLGWLCRFSAADHRLSDGPPAQSLRADADRFLAGHGVAQQSKILMLANPRVLGYVFNPLTLFYCYDRHGALRHAVAEVRNTYGGRHSYLLSTDEAGYASTGKQFYVSPFFPVDGHYTMRLPEPGAELRVAVTLHRRPDRPFTAVMTGRRSGARPSLWTALRTPLATRAVMFGIRRHGITLYLKGLRPVRRLPGSPSVDAAPCGRSSNGAWKEAL
ncbi:MAG: DUF1365 domain-containing protein [Jatrophihabitantaceae bacterium]